MSARDGARAGLSAVGCFIVGIVVLAAITGAVLGLRWAFAPANGAVEQREQTVGSGAYRIQAYDRFHDDCEAAHSLQQQIDVARDQLATAPPDPTRQAQLQANLTALRNQLISAVNQYNADASKTDTRAHFLSSDLPYQLSTEGEIRCAA